MDRVSLHATGPRLSRIVAGAWRWHNVSPETTARLIGTALDAGITSFDHADIYGDHTNEERFGMVLKKNRGWKSRMQIVSKCGIRFPSEHRPGTWIKHYDTSRQHIVWSAENSLQKLGVDHLDLLLIHRPSPLLDPLEVAAAFQDLYDAGKVLHFGVSNFTPSQFGMLQQHLPFPMVTNQIEISLSRYEPLLNGDLDFLMERRIRPMAWSPLGGGKPLGVDERRVFEKAARYNVTYSQLLLAWLLKHPSGILPVIGTTQPERISEAARAVETQLDTQDWFDMLQWVMGKEMP